MKKFLERCGTFAVFLGVVSFFSLLTIFVAEKTDVFGLSGHKLILHIKPLDASRLELTWEKFSYPCLYKVEVFSHTTGILNGEPEPHLIAKSFSFADRYELPSTAIPMFYRVSAYGVFGKLAGPSAPLANPNFTEPAYPKAIFRYDAQNPASLMPFLVWHVIPNAVCYEVEILSGPPDMEGGTVLSKFNHLFSTQQVYTNGYQADLTPWQNYAHLYWRARALGLHHEPIGEFSPAEPIVVDKTKSAPTAPLINDFDLMPNFVMPLYPVYDWIPLNGKSKYEVELMVKPPPQPNNREPVPDRAWHSPILAANTCYDEYARPYAGDYYWRVRAVDDNGNTIGTYSDAAKFTVKDGQTRVFAAVLGDSITHGGGAVSYSPMSLEYSYATYFDFPAINLGRSGDVSGTTLERFYDDVVPFRPKNLFILTGTNSLRDATISAETVINDIKSLQRNCERYGIRPIFLTLMPINPQNIQFAFHTETDPHWRDKLNTINAFIKTLPYHIDLEPYFYDATKSVLDYGFSVDGLHPDLKGKMLMGEIVNEHKELLAK